MAVVAVVAAFAVDTLPSRLRFFSTSDLIWSHNAENAMRTRCRRDARSSGVNLPEVPRALASTSRSSSDDKSTWRQKAD